MSDDEKAKQVVLEIIRQAGGVLTNKTNLYKAFYHAHLEYAKNNPGILSYWPIVRMPKGPGIDRFNVLLVQLQAEGMVHVRLVKHGKNTGEQYILAPFSSQVLTECECNAVRYGVNQVIGKTAGQVSDDSHECSHTWNDARNGEELPIYADLFSQEEYAEAKARAELAAEILRQTG